MSTLKTILKGAGLVFVGMAVSKVLTYAWRLLLARQGPETYGLLSLGIAVLSVAGVVSSLGLREGVLRFCAYYFGTNDQARLKGVLSSSLKFSITVSVLLAVALFYLADSIALQFFHKPEMVLVLKVFAFALPFLVLREMLLAAITSLQRMEYAVLARDVLDSLYKIVLAAVPVLLGWGLFGLSVGYAVALFLTALTIVCLFELRVFPLSSKITAVKVDRELFAYSLPLFFGALTSSSVRWMDTLFLGVYKAAVDVGAYNAAAPTAMLLLMVPTALLSLFLPVITSEFARNKQESIRQLYLTVCRWVLLAVLPLFLFLFFFPSQILAVLFGAEYASSGMVLLVLSVGYFLASVFWASDYMLNMLKKTKALMLITVVNVILTVALNVWLTPFYGSLGAAVATTVSLAAAALLSVFYTRHCTGLMPFGRRALAAVATSVLIFYAGQQFALAFNARTLLQFAVFGVLSVLYVFVVLKLKLVEDREVAFLRSAVQRFLPKGEQG